MKEHMLDIERFVGRYSLGKDSGLGSTHFLRVKVPGGFITSDQFRGVADLSERYGRKYAEVTDRQDIQLHWIEAEDALDIFSRMEEMGFATDMCGQGFKGARYGDVRNIVCCPLSGVARDEVIDVYPILKRISDFFIGNTEFLDLPRKFKIAMTGCGKNCVGLELNDLGLIAVKKGEEVGFTAMIGGGIGPSLPGPKLAEPFRIFIEPDDVFSVVKASIEIHRDNGNRENKAKARFKWLISEWGVERFKRTLEDKLGRKIDDYDAVPSLTREDHIGVQAQKQEDMFSVTIPLIGGVLSSDKMVKIAEAADEYGTGDIRLTPLQNVIVVNVQDTDGILKFLEKSGISMSGSRLRYTTIGCASDFCGKTINHHAKEMVKEILDYLEGKFKEFDELDFTMNISGCPNDCGRWKIADIGLRATSIRVNGERRQGYHIYLKDDAKLEAITTQGVPAEQIKYMIEGLLSEYLARRRGSESLGNFCDRRSVDELRSYLEVG